MKIGRYEVADKIFCGELADGKIYPLEGELCNLTRQPNVPPVDIRQVRVLSPVLPTKILALGPGHNNMMPPGREPPARPFLFFKPSSCVANPEDPILYPTGVSNILYELEIALVISKTACRVPEDKALDYILGYTCCNDVTAGSLKEDWGTQLSYHWKAFDSFGPLGPVITTDLGDIEGLAMVSRINGVIHADTKVSLIYSPADIVSWVSHIMTLNPGDVIALGAAAQADLKPGDLCEIEIEGIGCLRNRVIKVNE